jgi:hypothetical protein
MRYLYTLIILLTIITVSSCRKDFDTKLSNGNLKFSQDTIFFNRVFDGISSSTHRFTVINDSNDDITVPNIRLANGEDSFYRLNVDGIAGKSFENIDILAKDSIFVFIEATVDFSQVDENFMYLDQVLFDAGVNEQKVALEALVLDVNLIRPDLNELNEIGTIGLGIFDEEGEEITILGKNIDGDTTFGADNDKPYLVYNYIGVPSGTTLTINAGTQLHFHANSGIVVLDGGRLIVNGELDNQVIFEGDRLEEFFEDVPGQWGTIWLFNGSSNSTFNHTIIKNSTIGLLVDSDNSSQTLSLQNTQIYNTTSYGILGRNSRITAKNTVIANNGLASFGTILGGDYSFTQSTLVNYWRNSNRAVPTLLLSNVSSTFVAPLQASFINCIIDGNQNIEIGFESDPGASFNYKLLNCMLKFDDVSNATEKEPFFDITNTDLYENVFINENADFKNTNTFEGFTDLRIGEASFAINKANLDVINADVAIQIDILGVDRISKPDLGAYTNIIFEEDEE